VLHRIHRQLGDLRERLERGPKQVRLREQQLKNAEAELDRAQHSAQQCRMAADSKQVDLKANENKIQDWKGKLNSCKTNREYQALLEQIAAAEMAGSVLSDEILETLERVDLLDVKVREARQLVDKSRQELDRVRSRVGDESGSIRHDIERLEKELVETERSLPADFRGDYDRVVRAKGAEALAEVTDHYCGGCNQQITANMQNSLAMGRPVFCFSCGRLLYNVEDRIAEGRRG
jgi:predicted  nucleic acid-binding Zn-ribbon protein